MTTKQFAHAIMLISSLRTRLGHANALAAAVKSERDDLAKQLAAHVESLKLSNAQCGEYLLHNEMLAADRATLHKELVEVRAALASVSAERDSLKRTLNEWEEAETKPHARYDPPIRMGLISEPGPVVFVRIDDRPDDIADHVVPPLPFNSYSRRENKNVCGIFGCDPKQHGPCPLKFTNLTDEEAISRTLNGALPICMRKPLVEAPPVLPLCTTCHECGTELRASPAAGSHSVLYCRTERCSRKNTAWQDDVSPYHGPCTSTTSVRHE